MSSFELGYQPNRSTIGEKAALLLSGCRLAVQGAVTRVFRSAAFVGTDDDTLDYIPLYEPDGVTLLQIPGNAVVSRAWLWVKTASASETTPLGAGLRIGDGTTHSYPVSLAGNLADVPLWYNLTGMTVSTSAPRGLLFEARPTIAQVKLTSTTVNDAAAQGSYSGTRGDITNYVRFVPFTWDITGTDRMAVDPALLGTTFAAHGVWLEVVDINNAVAHNAPLTI